MHKILLFLAGILLLPGVSLAQQGVQSYLVAIVVFFNETLIPFIIVLAVLFFLVNIVRYFIVESTNTDGREKARRLAIWGILAFFLMLFIWGIINLFLYTFDIARPAYICPDYLENCDPTSDPQFSDFYNINEEELQRAQQRLEFERNIRQAEEQDPGFYGRQ